MCNDMIIIILNVFLFVIFLVAPPGLGYGMFVVSFLIGVYYNVVVAWSLRYLWASFTSELPWSTCDNEWNSESEIYRIYPQGG